MTSDEISLYSDYLNTITEGYILIDTYIVDSFITFQKITQNLKAWYVAQKCKKDFTTIIQNIFTSEIKYQKLSEKELEELCKGPKKRKKRVKKKPEATSFPSIETKIEELPEETPIIPEKPAPADLLDPILLKFIHLTKEGGETAARQLLMNYQDMETTNKKLQNLPPSYRTFFQIGALYYTLEQLLRFQGSKEINGNGHNLLRLNQLIGVKRRKMSPVISELYLANYWTQTPYEQFVQRLAWGDTPPKVLSEVHAFFDNGKELSDTSSMYQETVNFIDRYTKNLKEEELNPFEEYLFNPHLSIDEHEIEKLLQLRLPYPKRHPITCKLKQIMQALQILKVLVPALQKPTDSDEFSFLTRQFVFWMNNTLQGYLQTLYMYQTGEDTWEHDLLFLANVVKWKNALSDDDYHFLKSTFKNINKTCRYPFETKEIHSSLHEVVLKTELLREYPHIEEGFKFTSNSNLLSSKLNSISLPTENINLVSIQKTLECTWQHMYRLIQEKILPQIQAH